MIVAFHLVSTFGLVLCALAAAYAMTALAAILLAARHRHTPPCSDARSCPPVSVLKPLHGAEPRLYENLRSFCVQDHPSFQVLFGVRDANDAAIPVVHRLQREFPHLDLQLIVEARIHGRNRKVSNLMNIGQRAIHPLLVIADSDIAVGPDYLRSVCAPLAQPATGIVTCIYRARPLAGIWPRLGALFIDEWFRPSVQVAHLLGSRSFAFGATIALRRTTLDAIGGFAAIRDELADDYRLGELTRSRGLQTVLSDYLVTTDVTEDTGRRLWQRELRWLRTIRTLNPSGYRFMAVSFDLITAIIGATLTGGAPVALGLLAWVALVRVALHGRAAMQNGQPIAQAVATLPLLPVRDALSLLLWATGFLRRRVAWAGQDLRFDAKGLFHDAAP